MAPTTRARQVQSLIAKGFCDSLDEPYAQDTLDAHGDLVPASVHRRIGLVPRRDQRVERVGARLRGELAKATLGGRRITHEGHARRLRPRGGDARRQARPPRAAC